MNPTSSKTCDDPPPPGTELSDGEELSNSSSKKDGFASTAGGRAIDRIDPYLKSPEYIEYEKKLSSERSRFRSRSRSHGHYRRKRSRSRSTSRSRHRHKRSRSRRRRRHYSSSRSRSSSRGRNRDKHRHGSRDRRRRRRSTSRSRSRSRSKSRSRSHRLHRSRHERSKRSRSDYRTPSDDRRYGDMNTNETDMKVEEEEEEDDEPEPVKENAFKNDGSFLEMFKKMQEQQEKVDETTTNTSEVKKPLPVFGKRRGGKVLKTGLVQKTKIQSDEDATSAQDAWSVYMKEVRRYKEACCDDDSKTRPLVK